MEHGSDFTVVPEPEGSSRRTAGQHTAGGRRPFHRRRRDRRGRSLRTPLLPASVPASLSRKQQFDEYVLESAERLQQLRGPAIDSIEFHVEQIPHELETLAALGGRVPLGTYTPETSARPAAIIVYRHPVEMAAGAAWYVPELVHDAVVEQAAELLGLSPEMIDPTYGHFN